MRFGKVLVALLVAAFVVLLLSALVVYTPAEPQAQPVSPAPARVTLMPFVLPAQGGADAAAQTEAASRFPTLFVLLFIACALPKPVQRDANGRVLTSRRYENCFYPVFRPEVAGG